MLSGLLLAFALTANALDEVANDVSTKVVAHSVPVSVSVVPAATDTTAGAEAAARHAKRMACLKQAKTKKLLGTDRNSYVKACVTAR